MNKPAVNFHDLAPAETNFMQDVTQGLSKQLKAIAPKYFYDQRGSELFDEICKQPEYYLTQTEIGILQENAHDIARHIGSECILIELGSGASEKARLLFEALKPSCYLGVDISRDFLLQATKQLAQDYAWLEVHAVCADFSHQLELPAKFHNQPAVAFYPGSSIGNFESEDAIRFLAQLAKTVGPGGQLIIGVDLKKDQTVLDAAYNDSAGVTAQFNLNLLSRMRNELDADIDISRFAHEAFYNEDQGRMEMHLVSTATQHIFLDGKVFDFHVGESIHTENSYKYSLAEFAELAKQAGFEVQQAWTDEKQLFSVQLLTAM